MGPIFRVVRGSGRGTPYPLSFLTLVEVLTKMMLKAQGNGMVTGLIDHLIPNGIALMQYADDIILCLKNDMEGARNVKLLLYLFEQMTGLKINFEKSELIMVGGDNDLAIEFAETFNCQIGSFPIKYLGVPISSGRLHVVDWKKLEEKLERKLDVWQGNFLSIGGRSVLIKSSLSNATICHMSMFLLPKPTILGMEKNRRRFFWQGGGGVN
jgi:hypothetical protein